MAVPDFTVQVAFANNPGDTSYTWTTIHSDPATSRVRRLAYRRGRQREIGERIDTGTGQVTLKDTASVFDPDNTASPYYPNVVPMKPIRAQATIGGTTYDMFQHFVERWPRTFRAQQTYSEVEITTVDGFEWLAQTGLAGKSYGAQADGTRIGSILTDSGWSSTARALDTGNSTAAAITFADDDNTKTLDHIQQVATDTEEGLAFIDGRGFVVFIQRQALIQAPYTTSQAIFTDAPSGGVYHYTGLEPSYDRDHITNEWRGTRQGGSATLVAQDTSSQTKYGRRTDQFASLVQTDTETLNQAQWRLNRTKEPLNRIEGITVMPGNDTGLWQTVLGLEIGERITVKEQPPGFSTPKTRDYHIQSVQVDIPTAVSASRFTFGLFPADINQYWLAATAGYAEAGTTTRPVY